LEVSWQIKACGFMPANIVSPEMAVPTKRSAGILMYRRRHSEVEVLLVHPGGPFWKNKEEDAWSIPKGLYEDEDASLAARREFEEETGSRADGDLVALGSFRQPGGKVVTAFALEGDFDVASLRSNTFDMEWPPRSGRVASFPEVDRAEWLSPSAARRKLLKGQVPILEALLERVRSRGTSDPY
jgi:predicted NUDIX family NTP pyrophosphohydrolase